jgi:hypothetical protein
MKRFLVFRLPDGWVEDSLPASKRFVIASDSLHVVRTLLAKGTMEVYDARAEKFFTHPTEILD